MEPATVLEVIDFLRRDLIHFHPHFSSTFLYCYILYLLHGSTQVCIILSPFLGIVAGIVPEPEKAASDPIRSEGTAYYCIESCQRRRSTTRIVSVIFHTVEIRTDMVREMIRSQKKPQILIFASSEAIFGLG
jgi:hypothetical protein